MSQFSLQIGDIVTIRLNCKSVHSVLGGLKGEIVGKISNDYYNIQISNNNATINLSGVHLTDITFASRPWMSFGPTLHPIEPKDDKDIDRKMDDRRDNIFREIFK